MKIRMALRTFGLLFLATFALLAVVGLHPPSVGMSGDSGCPFSAEMSPCVEPLAHIDHWQNTFLTTLAEMFALISFALAVFFAFGLARDESRDYRRLRAQFLVHPTLFERLFAQGILNRRAP